MESRRPIRVVDDRPQTVKLQARVSRLNRSKKFDGKPGQYDGRPIISSTRLFREVERVA